METRLKKITLSTARRMNISMLMAACMVHGMALAAPGTTALAQSSPLNVHRVDHAASTSAAIPPHGTAEVLACPAGPAPGEVSKVSANLQPAGSCVEPASALRGLVVPAAPEGQAPAPRIIRGNVQP